MKLLNITVSKGLAATLLVLLITACGTPVAEVGLSRVVGPTGTLSAISYIPYNSNTTITWSTTGDVDCTLAGNGATGAAGTTGKSGSFITPRLSATTTYTLTCGSGNQSITITVASSAEASAITAFASAGSGVVAVTTMNTVADGTQITISGTTNYNGTYTVANRTDTTFTIAAPFNGNDATGYWQLAGGMIFGCSTAGSVAGLGAINLSTYSASRYKGVAPLSVIFDASDTTSGNAAIRPFHDIEYRWDFNENLTTLAALPGGLNWTNGSTKRSRNEATGPVAAHVFETPGVYNVKLTATDGTNTVTNQCAQIVVQAPDVVFPGTNTICISSSAVPSAGVGGCPVGAAVAQQADFATAVNTNLPTRKRILFKSGDTFSGSGAANISVTGPGMIGMYGTGAKPKILSTTQNVIVRFGAPNVLTMQDWRIMDLEFDGQSDAAITGFGANGNADQITILRLNVHDMGSGIGLDAGVLVYYAGTHSYEQFTVADSSFTTFRGGIGFYLFAKKLALLGNFVNDTNGGAAQHVVRIMHSAKGVVSNNTMGNPAPTKQVFTLRGVSYSPVGCQSGQCLPDLFPYGSYSALTSQTIVSDNEFVSGNTAQPVGVEPSNSTQDVRFEDILFERNWYKATAGGCCFPMLKIAAQEVTVRNELIDVTNGQFHMGVSISGGSGPSLPASNVRIYNNTIFSNDTADFRPVSVQTGATNITVRNNLAYSPNFSVTFNSGATTASNNTTNTQANPFFAAVPPATPSDFKIGTGSYAIGAGAVIPVWSDFFLVPQTTTRSLGAVVP